MSEKIKGKKFTIDKDVGFWSDTKYQERLLREKKKKYSWPGVLPCDKKHNLPWSTISPHDKIDDLNIGTEITAQRILFDSLKTSRPGRFQCMEITASVKGSEETGFIWSIYEGIVKIVPKIEKKNNYKFKIIKVKPHNFLSGEWVDKNDKNKIIKDMALFGDEVGFYIKTENMNGYSVVPNVYEYDPTIFDGDEEIVTLPKQVVKGEEIFIKIKLDEKWYDDESDKINELYLKLTGEKDGEKIEAEYPEKSDDYLKVARPGKKITVIIELPHSKEKSFIGRKGLAGHTAIAIGDEFYDFGPDYYTGPGGTQDPDSSYFYTPGKPWWDSFIVNNSKKYKVRKLEDSDLKQAKQYMQTEPGIYGEIHFIEFFVTNKEADDVKKWWDKLYKDIEKANASDRPVYSVLPWRGEQCTTCVRVSLDEAGVISGISSITPKGFLDDLKKYAVHTAGVDSGKKAKAWIFQKEKSMP